MCITCLNILLDPDSNTESDMDLLGSESNEMVVRIMDAMGYMLGKNPQRIVLPPDSHDRFRPGAGPDLGEPLEFRHIDCCIM